MKHIFRGNMSTEDPYIKSLLATISDLKAENAALNAQLWEIKEKKLKTVIELNELIQKVLVL